MKKLLSIVVLFLIGETLSFAEDRSVTYVVDENGSLTIEGLEPSGSVAEFTNTYHGLTTPNKNQMTGGNTSTLKVQNYDEYIVKELILRMESNALPQNGSYGAGTFYFKVGNDTLAEISSAKEFYEWYDNNTTNKTDINVTFKDGYGNGYKVKENEELEINISASTNSLYIYAYTIIYEKLEDLVDIPRITPTKGDVFYRKQQINISCEADVDAIFFTTDGTKPTTASQIYDANVPLYIDKETTIKTFATKGEEQTKVNEKTFKKNNLKAIVTKYDGNFYGMTNKKRETSEHLLSATCSVYHNSIVLCSPENLTTFAWLINNDKKIQDYKSLNYLYCSDKNKTNIKLEKEKNTTWDVSDTYIKADNGRYLCCANAYFGAYTTTDNSAYPLDLVKGYTRDKLSSEQYGTICLPYDVLNDDRMGATFYNIAGKKTDENNNVVSLILEEETGTLIAGRPYIFEATGDALCCMYLDIAEEGNAAQAGNHNGLCGSFSDVKVDEDDDNYIIKNNKIVKSDANCWIAANRAYINMEEVPDLEYDTQVSKRTVSISIDGEATSIGGTIIEK